MPFYSKRKQNMLYQECWYFIQIFYSFFKDCDEDGCKCGCGKQALTYMPNHPQLCHRGSFVLDDKREKKGCTKKLSNKHASLVPGLFLLSCPHDKYFQILSPKGNWIKANGLIYFSSRSIEWCHFFWILSCCYGYQIMDEKEGVGIPYALIRTRLRGTKQWTTILLIVLLLTWLCYP